MLMVISPAKTLDYETPPATPRFTQPEHLDHAQDLIQQLRDFTPAQIAELMHLSDKLAGLNAARFGSWERPFNPSNAKQALLASRATCTPGLTPRISAKPTSTSRKPTCVCFPVCTAYCVRST